MISKIKAYFNISRSEWRGMIVVFFLLMLTYIFNKVYEKQVYSPLKFSVEEIFPLSKDALSPIIEKSGTLSSKTKVAELFIFNPNGLSLEDWMKLGLSYKQALSIKKYEDKGGRFLKKEDLKKMYVISEEVYRTLEPYISIPKIDVNRNLKPELGKAGIVSLSIDINSVDSSTIQLIKGIGPAYASRIIKYRDRLGGFIKKEQLRDVYGVDSLKFAEISPHIKIDTQHVRFIDINAITIEEFRRFPYLTYRQKSVILAYRKQHGAYQNFEQIRKAALLDLEIMDKITPYIKFK